MTERGLAPALARSLLVTLLSILSLLGGCSLEPFNCEGSSSCSEGNVCCDGQCLPEGQCDDSAWEVAEVIGPDEDIGEAKYPRVAVDANGAALVVWQQSDGTQFDIWANRYSPADGWGIAELIETDAAGPATHPQIAVQSGGAALAIWQQSDGTRDSIWANRYSPSSGWAAAELVETDELGDASHPQIAFDGNGNALAVWQQWDGSRVSIWANRYEATGGWGTPELIETDDTGQAEFPQIAVDVNGNGFAVWQQGEDYSIWANVYRPGEGWGAAELIDQQDAAGAGNPQVATGAAGTALAVWHQSDGSHSSIWASRYDTAEGWSAPERVERDDGGNAWDPQVVMDRDGNALVVWEHWDDEHDRWAILANRYTSDGGWSSPETIESDLSGRGSSPQLAGTLDGSAISVWEDWDGTRTKVWANRYEPEAGWDAAKLIDAKDMGGAGNPSVCIDPQGGGFAVWAQSDGTRDIIWANQSSGCDGEDCESGGACTNENDDAVFSEPDFRQDITDCSFEELLNEVPLETCLQEETGISSECASCWRIFYDCVNANCIGECLADTNSPGCTDCVSTHCLEPTEACAGRPVPL